jgi:hypothetical protein
MRGNPSADRFWDLTSHDLHQQEIFRILAARDSWPGTPASRRPNFGKTKHVALAISAGGTPNAAYFLQTTAWITFVFAAITLKRASAYVAAKIMRH